MARRTGFLSGPQARRENAAETIFRFDFLVLCVRNVCGMLMAQKNGSGHRNLNSL
jgi:hypothetical protein